MRLVLKVPSAQRPVHLPKSNRRQHALIRMQRRTKRAPSQRYRAPAPPHPPKQAFHRQPASTQPLIKKASRLPLVHPPRTIRYPEPHTRRLKKRPRTHAAIPPLLRCKSTTPPAFSPAIRKSRRRPTKACPNPFPRVNTINIFANE